MNSYPPNQALQRTRRERRGCNGFVRARSLSPAGLLSAVEFLSRFSQKVQVWRPVRRVAELGSLGRFAHHAQNFES